MWFILNLELNAHETINCDDLIKKKKKPEIESGNARSGDVFVYVWTVH